jgi:hypothetical protein
MIGRRPLEVWEVTTIIDREFAPRDASRPLPWTVWALLAGAAGQLVVKVLPDWYSVFGPYFLVDGGMVIGWIRAVAPFLLAASVIVGADRWPAGRRFLHAGAGALAVFAVLSLVDNAWWAVWEMNPGEIPSALQPWLTARGIGAGLALLAAYGVMAIGLWVAGTHRSVGSVRLLMMACIGALALAGTAVGLWQLTLFRMPDGGVVTAVAVVAYGVLTPLSFAALGAVGIAAIRAMPERGATPEVLIAAGATLAVTGLGWLWSVWAVIPPQDLAFETAELLSSVLGLAVVIGMVAMVSGFVAGALAPRPTDEDTRTES